jgi:hypothetical protein
LKRCRHVLQLAKAQKVVAAVPAALQTIRSSNRLSDDSSPEAAPAVQQPTPAARQGFAAGQESPSPNVEALLQKIPQEYRPDIVRMLLASQEKHAAPG